MQKIRNTLFRRRGDLGLTLLELLAVAVILGILATIAQNVYIGQVQRAKISATRSLLRELEIAITRYEIDAGEYPPTGSQEIVIVGGDPVTSGTFAARDLGSGLLHLSLVHSLTGDATNPLPGWGGPYINFQADQLTTGPMGDIEILDAFRSPIIYVRSDDYSATTTPIFGTQMFGARGITPPAEVLNNADPDLPNPNPFAVEIFYNVSTFQLISLGPDGTSFGLSGSSDPTSASIIYIGTERDDINNFGF